MSQLNRVEEIRLGCLQQATLLFAATKPKILNEEEVVDMARTFELFVRDIYVKGTAAKRPDEKQVVLELTDAEEELVDENWCVPDDCPVEICGGPHVVHDCTAGKASMRPDQLPCFMCGWDGK